MRNGFPSVSTMDLAIQERESALIIGTFGRSIWIIDDLITLRKAATGIAKDFSVLPLNDAVQVKGIFIAPPGNIWTGFHTTFEGENRPFGEAIIPFYVRSPSLDKEKNKVTVNVLNEQNQLIQTVTTTKIDSGLNYLSWRLDEKTSKLPGGWDDPETKGILALPGKYKVVLNYLEKKDSTYVKVIPDPRFEYSQEVEETNHAILKRLDKTTEILAQSLDKLNESNEVVDKILIQLKDAKSQQRNELISTSNAMKELIKKLMESATGSRPIKQVGAWSSFQVTAQSKVTEAQQALRARLYKPSVQDVQRVEVAEQLTKEFVEKVDTFFSKDWRDYQNKIESARLSWFEN
jgi:hypothetical protein